MVEAAPSRLLAGLSLAIAFPGAVVVAYFGYLRGFYPYAALPFAVAAVLLVTFIGLFALLPRLRSLEG